MKKESRFFAGRRVVVYGATGGLGEALCTELCSPSKAARLVLAGRSEERLQAVQKRLTAQQAQARQTVIEVWPVPCVPDFAQRIQKEELDGLIIATGRTAYQRFHTANRQADAAPGTEECSNTAQWREYEQILDVNLHQVLQLALELLPYLARRQGFLHIAGSYTCIFPVPYQAVYSASKAALLSFVQAAIREAPAQQKQHQSPLSISLIGGMATNMVYQSDLQSRFGAWERWVLSPPQRIARGILRGIARRKAIITIKWNGFLIYHVVRRLPSAWLGRALERAYRPPK